MQLHCTMRKSDCCIHYVARLCNSVTKEHNRFWEEFMKNQLKMMVSIKVADNLTSARTLKVWFKLKFHESVQPPPCVTCRMANVTRHVSHVRCHVSDITCHIFFKIKWWGLLVEGLLSKRLTLSSYYANQKIGILLPTKMLWF